MRYIRLDHENASLNTEIVSAEVRSSLQGGPSVVFEVLKSLAVESLQTLLKQEVPKHIAGASYDSLFFAPSNLKDAETVRLLYLQTVCILKPFSLTLTTFSCYLESLKTVRQFQEQH